MSCSIFWINTVFVRIQISYLVNVKFIERVDGKNVYLRNGIKKSISPHFDKIIREKATKLHGNRWRRHKWKYLLMCVNRYYGLYFLKKYSVRQKYDKKKDISAGIAAAFLLVVSIGLSDQFALFFSIYSSYRFADYLRVRHAFFLQSKWYWKVFF